MGQTLVWTGNAFLGGKNVLPFSTLSSRFQGCCCYFYGWSQWSPEPNAKRPPGGETNQPQAAPLGLLFPPVHFGVLILRMLAQNAGASPRLTFKAPCTPASVSPAVCLCFLLATPLQSNPVNGGHSASVAIDPKSAQP